jgi:hypothetical protein
MFKETSPLRNEFMKQLMDVLKTGGSKALVPSMARAFESSKSAASKAYTGASEDLSRSGLADSPFGQMVLASQRMQGEQASADTQSEISSQFLSQLVPFLQAMTGSTIGGFGSLVAAESGNVKTSSSDINMGILGTK